MHKDEELMMVASCQQGDKKAMDTLVRQLQKPIYNAAYRMLGTPDEAADVAQSTFLKVFENIDRFDPKFKLFSWVYRIAVNESLDQIKRRGRTETLQHTPESNTGQPPENVATAQLSQKVQATLMQISGDHRTVIVLRYFSECSYEEIGRILDLPEKTVKSRLFSARLQLKNKLNETGVVSS